MKNLLDIIQDTIIEFNDSGRTSSTALARNIIGKLSEEGFQILDSQNIKEVQEIIASKNKMQESIKEVLELFDGNGVPNISWIKEKLLESLKD